MLHDYDILRGGSYQVFDKRLIPFWSLRNGKSRQNSRYVSMFLAQWLDVVTKRGELGFSVIPKMSYLHFACF